MEQTQTAQINVSNLMTAQDYAKLKGVTRKTVYNWIDTNKIQQVSFLGKNWVDISTHVK